MKEPRWIAGDEARALHGMQLAAFGGPAGMRDEGLLESALARLAAAYAFGIVRNHPFLDGNKRTGLVVAFVFLELNGVEVRACEEEAYEVFMRLAAGKMSERELGEWLEKDGRFA